MKAKIGIVHGDSREVYIFYMEEGVDDQENIRRIMESSCNWEFLWVLEWFLSDLLKKIMPVITEPYPRFLA